MSTKIGDDFNVLLDCGWSSLSIDDIRTIRLKLREYGPLDCVLLSHADMQHVGALPFLLGCDNLSDVPVICTTPVLKMSQMTLYDAHINNSMVKTAEDIDFFTLDDIDHCFRNAITLKYNQTSRREHRDGRAGEFFVCAYAAGRTLGGASWCIRCGSIEVIYTMDFNLRRETLLEGGSLDLPASPALLIVGGGKSDQSMVGSTAYRRKKDRGDDGLVSAILNAVRSDGNVLLPSTSVGRTLELLLILNRHWVENSLGMYHLVFLSPMACNIIEFARCQLEWMSDILCHDFYMGKPNPFALPAVKILTSLRELDQLGPGPRVVLTTDSTLSCGFSRQLLLRWGGDPKCLVLFPDMSEDGSLANELRSQAQPVIATIMRSEKVPLTGSELEEFQKAEALRRRNLEAAFQRRRRERELTDLATMGTASRDQVSSSTEPNPELEDTDPWADADILGSPEDESVDESVGSSKRRKVTDIRGAQNDDVLKLALSADITSDAQSIVARGRITRFAQPRYRMFETRDIYTSSSDYGRSIEDFRFRDISSSTFRNNLSRGPNQDDSFSATRTDSDVNHNFAVDNFVPQTVHDKLDFGVDDAVVVPTKIVGKKTLVQFTCGFKEVNMSGRSDTRTIKTIVTKLSPQRVVVLQGSGNIDAADRKSIATSIRETVLAVWAPAYDEVVDFIAETEKIKLLIPQAFMSGSVSAVHEIKNVSASSQVSACSTVVFPRGCKFIEANSRASDGIRSARVMVDSTVLVNDDLNSKGTVCYLGAVSVGEVLLETLKRRLEATGVSVEYMLGRRGGMLLCDGVVAIRKENDNDIVVEGTASPALAAARKTLSDFYTFL